MYPVHFWLFLHFLPPCKQPCPAGMCQTGAQAARQHWENLRNFSQSFTALSTNRPRCGSVVNPTPLLFSPRDQASQRDPGHPAQNQAGRQKGLGPFKQVKQNTLACMLCPRAS